MAFYNLNLENNCRKILRINKLEYREIGAQSLYTSKNFIPTFGFLLPYYITINFR